MAIQNVAAQNAYWVMLTDKTGSTFDPTTYFDTKALERYAQCGANPADISNFPVSENYVDGVAQIATDTIGQSRWLNAVAVTATKAQAEAIAALPYVSHLLPIADAPAVLATYNNSEANEETGNNPKLTDQLVRMQGQNFRDHNIDGRGVRIAVFDGGFPRVNTHAAFRHLRDEGRIIKTWNFCNRCENVYGWNSHGTMTLSCIAGREGERDLGLATGAEFLLARTEVELEPAKEEVWWMQAMEWADRNGAQVISSSLGYGKERYFTRDMDGTSLVARAANMAARKGILVCNSAGNEATDRQWTTIITPSDADSVLCVGGIEHDLNHYRHISFSSFGPSADGRQKPNVVAFGHARTANTTGDESYHYVDGTSFSCPLVAGFAACAIQAMPGKSAMQMMDEIQRSADLYPYCDYAFGYGVPQASYFTSTAKPTEPTFRFVEVGTDSVMMAVYKPVSNTTVFYRYIKPDGTLSHYGSCEIEHSAEDQGLIFAKASVFNRTLEVHLDGYTAQYRLPAEEQQRYINSSFWYEPDSPKGVTSTMQLARNGASANKTSKWGGQSKYRYDIYLQYGMMPNTMSDELTVTFADAGRVGFRLLTALSKTYCLGFGLEYGHSEYALTTDHAAPFEWLVVPTPTSRRLKLNEWSLELFQRVRLAPGGQLSGRGIHWDLGLYGSLTTDNYVIKWQPDGLPYASEERTYKDLSSLGQHRINYGLTTRFGYSILAVYARYRLNTLIQKPTSPDVALPRLEVGLQLNF